MNRNINLQFFISYIGLFPYLIIIIDKFFLHQIDINILQSFSIFYSIVILVFIGSINWNLKEQIATLLVLYGFLPSLFSIVVIILYLHNFSVINLIIIFFLFQMFCDYFLIYAKDKNISIFYGLRLPLTIMIVLSLFVIQ